MTPWTLLNILQFITGIVLAMVGYSLLRNSPRWGGFFVGGLITAHVAVRMVALEGILNLLTPVGGFVVGGLVGMIIAGPLYMLMAVISSCSLGAIIGMMAGLIVDKGGATNEIIEAILSFNRLTDIQISMAVVFALVFGVLALKFEDFMTMASTSFMGSLLVMVSLSAMFGNSTPLLRNGVFFFFAVAGFGLLALISQNRNET